MLVTILGWLLIALVIIGVVRSVVVVTKTKNVSIIEQFGQYKGYKTAGLSFKMPWPIQTVANVLALNIQQLKTNLELKTSDNLFIQYPINIQFQVIDPEKANYELDDPEKQIRSYVNNLIRSEVGKKTFLELYNVRDEIKHVVEEVLSQQMKDFGFKIVDVLVDEPIPTEDVQNSYNSVTASEREKEAAKNRAEASRIAIIADAEAQKESKRLQGEGIAAQRHAISVGFKEDTDSIANALGISNEMATGVLIQLNKLDTLRDVSKGEGTLIISDGSSASELKELSNLTAAMKALENKKA
jgi:regulator of protease activity HflC (stomatin/prohibitin superfamily)